MYTLIDGITTVFDAIGDWIISAFSSMQSIFWVAESEQLTFMGILAVCGLAMSVIFLIIGIIQRFLHFAG